MDCLNNLFIKCTPKPDAFNPCEDLLGFPALRCLTWIIAVFAVSGNLAVLVILLISQHKLTISRFLMCNLVLADMCMGLYLMLIYRHSHHEYYNHATEWQTGPGCSIAGFLTVFARELSVYTMMVISLERWHTITIAMHVNKRLRMSHVTAIIVSGWGFSLLVPLLPLVGISSYSKVSMCLPMDIDTPGYQVYVMAVLIFNVVAFLKVCYFYVCIYLSVHNPEHSARNGDIKLLNTCLCYFSLTLFACRQSPSSPSQQLCGCPSLVCHIQRSSSSSSIPSIHSATPSWTVSSPGHSEKMCAFCFVVVAAVMPDWTFSGHRLLHHTSPVFRRRPQENLIVQLLCQPH